MTLETLFISIVHFVYNTVNFFFIFQIVKLSACDSDPCINGGYCKSDTENPELYECRCGDWFKGTNCEG